ncbi:hypothetical protein [Marinomonas sp. FW-1]|nr:hypothetical protein [Marinomonas sp. FW-1]
MNVAGADLAADTEFEVVVTSSDAAGNTVESKATSIIRSIWKRMRVR